MHCSDGPMSCFLRSSKGILPSSSHSFERAGIRPAIGIHVLPHAHASHLAMRGMPMAVSAQVLGRADTHMTERHYAQLSPNYIAETVRSAIPMLGIS